MKIRILALGHRQPAWVQQATQEYLKRLPREMGAQLVELKPEPRTSGRSTAQILELEAQRLRQHFTTQDVRYTLDEQGALWTTLTLAQALERHQQQGVNPCFIIGSADGLHPLIKQESQTLIALSRMTLPHGLVRVLLAEQLYRCHSLLQGHPYHRA